MSLEDFLDGQQWAIKTEVLEGFVRLLDLRSSGADLESFAAKMSGAAQQHRAAKPQGTTAIIPVDGTLSKRTFLFDCGSTYAGIREAIQTALDDPSVSSILLDVDSPGGTVSGVSELADYIAKADKIKPVYAYTDGLMCSAAYWLACAARQIMAAPTATVGSIGVLATHTDRSARDQSTGIKRTMITAGSHKAIGHDAAPLDDKSRAVIQGNLDQLYGIFTSTVATNRNLAASDAEHWADGKVFLAADAKAQGLIDDVGTRDNLLAKISHQEEPMDLKQLKAEHPDLVTAIKAEATAEISETLAKAESASAQAVQAEQGRVVGLVKVMFGEETGAKLEGLAKSGMTQEMAVSAKDLLGGTAAPKADGPSQAQKEALAALEAANAKPLKNGAEAGGLDFMALVAAAQKNDPKLTKAQAFAHVARTHTEAHQAWVQQQQPKAQKA